MQRKQTTILFLLLSSAIIAIILQKDKIFNSLRIKEKKIITSPINDKIEKKCIKELLLAAREGNFKLVRECIEDGVDVNSYDVEGNSALIYATEEGHIEIAQYLIEIAKAKVDMINKLEETPLIKAATIGDETIVLLLLKAGAEVDKKGKNGWTPLMKASCLGHLQIVQYLIENKANLEAEDNEKQTAIMFAAYNGQLPVVKYLIEKRAKVDAQNEHKETALMLATCEGHLPVVKYLIEEGGATLNLKDKNGDTALIIARDWYHKELVDYLKAYKKTN